MANLVEFTVYRVSLDVLFRKLYATCKEEHQRVHFGFFFFTSFV